jgi:hypothetical protein
MADSPCIILLRHAERLDRSLESKGEDWISTATRPQDSPISPFGVRQAKETGVYFKQKLSISRVISSPMIRTVQTSDIICGELGLGVGTICIEQGLVEEAKSFRGKTSDEPKPNWDPIMLSPEQLTEFSDKIDCSYRTMVPVHHELDTSLPNSVREMHPSLTDEHDITRDRYAWIALESIN